MEPLDLATIQETEEVELSWGKHQLVELAQLGFERYFREDPAEYPREEVCELEVAEVELGGADDVELYIPPRFTEATPKLGLRPGFAVYVSEHKPSGGY